MAMTQTSEITDIEELHRQSILNKQTTYIDPSTGFTVFTELAHLKRGRCCGNMCRHCPFGYSNVKGLDPSLSNQHAMAVSGDRVGTNLLVDKIMNGTYYEEQCFDHGRGGQLQIDDCGQQQPIDITANVQNERIMTQTETIRGKGGYAGGTLTNKNVPYTRKGDTGTSQLFTGERRSKDDVIFEAMGTVDELCCIIGTVYADLVKNDTTTKSDADATCTDKEAKPSSHKLYGELPDQLLDVMSRLFDVGSHIARPSASKEKQSRFPSHHTNILEEWIDTMTEQLPELTSFILPTGSSASASLHVARTVCRRAERRMVPLIRDHECCDPNSLSYVNRLSDYLFTAARFVNYCDGMDEVQYRRERGMKSGEVGGRERVVVRLKD
jgi:cob(I)alamin adenosyltransferase